MDRSEREPARLARHRTCLSTLITQRAFRCWSIVKGTPTPLLDLRNRTHGLKATFAISWLHYLSTCLRRLAKRP
jgi:hypothetical protein